MRTLDRLVVWTFIKLFVLSITATPFLFALGEFTENIENHKAAGLTWAEILLGYGYRLPEYVVLSFPIAGLVAAIFTVHGMTAHREIVAAKAGGFSFHRLVFPIIVVSTLLTGGALALTEVVPDSNRKSSEILKKLDFTGDWRSDIVYRTDNGYTLSARRLMVEQSEMSGVLLVLKGRDTLPTIHIEAESARYTEGQGWTLLNGTQRYVYADGSEQSSKFDSTPAPADALTERPDELMDTPREDNEMSYAELGRAAKVVERAGGRYAPLLVAQQERIAIPVATLVIILFGLPLATSSNRGGAAFGIGAALGTTIFYMLLLKVGLALGSAGNLPPYAAAWAPNAVFLLAALVFLSRVRT
jgi:lipopolysaccharide export system permease protein